MHILAGIDFKQRHICSIGAISLMPWPGIVDGSLNFGGQLAGAIVLILLSHGNASQGSMTSSPPALNGLVSRVATMRPCAAAVAAM